jgi:hypothetical protein
MKIYLSSILEKFSDVEFFVACIFPAEPPEFHGAGTDSDLLVVNSPQFWAVSSRSPSSQAGLIHKIAESFIVFRGYEALIGAHSYSSVAHLSQIAAPENLQNGVFSFISFDPVSQSAIIKNDAFGVSPMFYREKNGAWFFASHPGLVHLADDAPDLTSWLSLMQNGYVLGDQTFYNDIKRFPAGTEMVISPGLCETKQWFDFTKLPGGDRPVDDEAIDAIEAAYRTAMERCLKLKVGEVALPFTSGFDSRRFFALLVRNKIAFRTITCQTFNRKNGRDYDIDSTYAPKIAAAFGIDGDVVPASSGEQLVVDSVKRSNLIGTETFMHQWAMPLMRWLAGRPPSLVFDGLAGDVFGNSSFDIEGLEGSPNRSAAQILEKVTKPLMMGHLSFSPGCADDYREKYRQYIGQFSPNMNQSQLAFLQARTRRGVSPWMTMMHPPGHVVVFPYCDTEFARVALTYDPGQKYSRSLQRECLQRFYPEFYDFQGSRNLPADHMPIDQAISFARHEAEEKYAYGNPSIIWAACQYLSLPNRALLLISCIMPSLRRRRDWLFRPLLMILRTQRQAVPYISLGGSARTVQHEGRSIDDDTADIAATAI